MTEPSKQGSGRHLPSRVRWHPDAKRAHGAWIYLFLAIAAGAVVGSAGRVEPAMLAGTGFAGAFLFVAALDAGPRRKLRQLLVGACLAIIAPLAALWLGAPLVFLSIAALALLPAVSTVLLSRTTGTLSTGTLVVGVAALTMAAPVTAVAGGSSTMRAAALFGLLWLFYGWQTIRVNASLPAGAVWNRASLRARGLREAAKAAAWTLAVSIGFRIF